MPAISHMASVPCGDSFLLVGGKDHSRPLGFICRYEADEDRWIEIGDKLATPRSGLVAFTVKKEAFTRC